MGFFQAHSLGAYVFYRLSGKRLGSFMTFSQVAWVSHLSGVRVESQTFDCGALSVIWAINWRRAAMNDPDIAWPIDPLFFRAFWLFPHSFFSLTGIGFVTVHRQLPGGVLPSNFAQNLGVSICSFRVDGNYFAMKRMAIKRSALLAIRKPIRSFSQSCGLRRRSYYHG